MIRSCIEPELLKGTIEVVDALFEYRVDVNARDNYGDTALTLAAAKLKPTLCRLLLSHGADIRAANNYGLNILHIAALTPDPYTTCEEQIAEIAISRGLNVNALDKSGCSPLYLAISSSNKEVAAILRKHGAKSISPPVKAPRAEDIQKEREIFNLLISKSRTQLTIVKKNVSSYESQYKQYSSILVQVDKALDDAGESVNQTAINNLRKNFDDLKIELDRIISDVEHTQKTTQDFIFVCREVKKFASYNQYKQQVVSLGDSWNGLGEQANTIAVKYSTLMPTFRRIQDRLQK